MADTEVNPFAKFVSPTSSATPTEDNENPFAKFATKGTALAAPEKTSGVGTFFREGAMATPATIAAIGAGELATVATAPILGPAAPVAGLVAGGAVGFGVSYLGEKGMDELEAMGPLAQKFMKTLGVDHATREAGRKEHEYAALAGQIASGGPFMSTAAKNIGQRVVGGGIQTGVGYGTRAAMGEEQDPVKSAIEFGAGFAAPGQLNKLGKKIPGVKPEAAPTPKPSDIPERPPAGSSPEVLAEHAAKLDAIIAKRKEDKAAKAPLEQAAMMNTETGELIKMGPKHDPAKKAEFKNDPAWQEGFLDTNGAFHERVAAVDQAKRSGQIPEDHVLESPPGERGGLHTGDMRKAGVKEFDVTSDTPAGVSTSPSVRTKEPVTREEHKTAIDDLQTKITELHKEAATAMAEQNDARVVEADKQIAELKAQQDKLKGTIPAVKFADMSAPTWKELHDHLWGANNMGEAFDRILAVKGLGSYAERLLIKGLNESEFVRSAGLSFTNERIKYTDKQGVEKQDAVGLYTGGNEHRVQIGKDVSLADFAHEGMHAGTQRLLNEEGSNAAIQMKALFDKYKASHGDASYGFNDVHEFVAEAFTDKDFQMLLKSIPVGQQPKGVANNAWGAFKEVVRLGLGIPEGARTALDEVMDKGISMVKQSKGFTKRADRDSLMSSPSMRPVELDDTTPPKYLYHGTKADVTKMIDKDGNLVLKPSKNYGGKTESVSLTHNKDVANDYAAWTKGGGPDAFEFSGAKTIKIHSDALPEGISRESPEEWAFNTDKPIVIPKGKFEVIEHPLSKTLLIENPEYTIKDYINDHYSWMEKEELYLSEVDPKEDEMFLDSYLESAWDEDGEPFISYLSRKEEVKKEIQRLKDIREKRIADTYKEPAVEWNDKPKTSPSVFKESLSKEAPEVVEAIDKVDPRTMPDKEAMYEHAANIQEKYGKEQALKFVTDYEAYAKEQSIPVPHNEQGLDDALHKVATFETKDRSELTTWYKDAIKSGVTKQQLKDWFLMRERGMELPPEAKALHEAGDKELTALVKKIKAMGGDVGDEFLTGQSRVRVFGGVTNNWREMLKEFFANKTPMGEKMADQANAAMERSVFGLKTWTGDKDVKGAVLKDTERVIELHKHPKDTMYSYQDEKGKWKKVQVKQGTSIWEWKNGKKTMIGHSDDLDLKRGSSIELRVPDEKAPSPELGAEKRIIKSQAVISDGKVPDIERHAPYRYLQDSLASQAIALMGLRKMARDLELMNNLTKSELFKAVGHAPDAPLKDLPKGWRIPDNIDKIPQLRGWHFDPKTAAIIEDFAKVWDNTMWMKLSNQIVKNMMLNPIPHMFNEVMHLWNARGFTGWVNPVSIARFGSTSRQAWRDVGQQTQFYRDLMREGGSILGADPRNKLFDQMIMDEGKKYMEDPVIKNSMGQLAKKLGTSVGDLYNGISSASQKAMWFTRDVMYTQYIREIMKLNPEMSMKDAIAKGEQHMPNYRMPSEVLGSRGLAKTLKNPNISMFSRYHYGMVKSLVNTVKDIDPRNLQSPEGRKHFREGVDSMLAIGVAMGVLYPLMDSMASAIFGEGAEQRRAGPFHLLKAGVDVAEGKKDASALIWPVFTFNPALLSLGQLAFNKNIFTGKAIYHPQDPLKDIASDVGAYATKQLPQAPGIMGAVQDDGGASNLLAKQLDIKAKTERQKAREKRAIEYGQREAKGRAKQRAKGTYTP